MPNIATALKQEISRIARKELRGQTDSMKKAVAAHRHEIAVLKKRLQALERQLKGSARKAVAPAAASEGESGRQLRFSATRFAAQRQKLGISAASLATLLGVSPISIYKWEGGKARPRRAQLEVIAAARKLGRREALARLEELSSPPAQARKRA